MVTIIHMDSEKGTQIGLCDFNLPFILFILLKLFEFSTKT